MYTYVYVYKCVYMYMQIYMCEYIIGVLIYVAEDEHTNIHIYVY